MRVKVILFAITMLLCIPVTSREPVVAGAGPKQNGAAPPEPAPGPVAPPAAAPPAPPHAAHTHTPHSLNNNTPDKLPVSLLLKSKSREIVS